MNVEEYQQYVMAEIINADEEGRKPLPTGMLIVRLNNLGFNVSLPLLGRALQGLFLQDVIRNPRQPEGHRAWTLTSHIELSDDTPLTFVEEQVLALIQEIYRHDQAFRASELFERTHGAMYWRGFDSLHSLYSHLCRVLPSLERKGYLAAGNRRRYRLTHENASVLEPVMVKNPFGEPQPVAVGYDDYGLPF